MPYTVRLKKKANNFYLSTDRVLAKKLARCFAALEKDPRKHPNIKPLKEKLSGRYRYRVGDYRVIYRIDDQTVEVLVLLIEHRSDAYD